LIVIGFFEHGLGLSSGYRSPKIKLHDIKHQPLVRRV
jgi:hypothetical protein